MTDWRHIHEHHGLAAHTRTGSRFVSAEWSVAKRCYSIVFAGEDAKPFTVEAEVLVSAIGGLSQPLEAPPSLSGLAGFKGALSVEAVLTGQASAFTRLAGGTTSRWRTSASASSATAARPRS